MTDETLTENTESEAPTPEPQETENTEQKPPWGDEDFNPDTAWKLVQNTRADREKLKAERDELAAKIKAVEDEKMTEQERVHRDLEAAQQQLAEVNLQKAWAEARATHPQLTDEDFSLLGASTPEEVSEKAAKLAARIASQAPADPKLATNPLRAQPHGGVDPSSSVKTDWLRDALNNK